MRKLHNGYNICLFWETKEESQIKSFLYGEENTLKFSILLCFVSVLLKHQGDRDCNRSFCKYASLNNKGERNERKLETCIDFKAIIKNTLQNFNILLVTIIC